MRYFKRLSVTSLVIVIILGFSSLVFGGCQCEKGAKLYTLSAPHLGYKNCSIVYTSTNAATLCCGGVEVIQYGTFSLIEELKAEDFVKPR